MLKRSTEPLMPRTPARGVHPLCVSKQTVVCCGRFGDQLLAGDGFGRGSDLHHGRADVVHGLLDASGVRVLGWPC